ncbi:MAG: hypothetical protein NTX66_04085, partial [Candidatus Falkowbacteria bacterium]|nr:hypothetical protein [Candidatus Falkowbacteria bacterium]
DNLSSKAKTIFVANQIHNLFSLVEDYKNTKAKLWEIFGASEELMALYYADIMEKVIASFHNSIVTDYYDIFLEACRLFGWRITYEEAVKSLVWAKEFKEE